LSDEFRRFDSKFDFVQRGDAQFTPQEAQGFVLFNDPEGNCAACHPASGSRPLFTDFTYDNLGVPRNRAITATATATSSISACVDRRERISPALRFAARSRCPRFATWPSPVRTSTTADSRLFARSSTST
jgi:cytochrome c peroxidase